VLTAILYLIYDTRPTQLSLSSIWFFVQALGWRLPDAFGLELRLIAARRRHRAVSCEREVDLFCRLLWQIRCLSVLYFS